MGKMVWQIVGNPTFYIVDSAATDAEFTALAQKYNVPVLNDGKGKFFVADGVVYRFLPQI